MRLIDANKLVDYFYYGIDDKPIIDGISDRKIINIIKNQPTVYDVDKVVEEFDKKYNNSLWIKGNEEFSITRNELIKIVKQGGVSDDVCEWKQDNMFEAVYRVCGGFSTTVYQKDFEYCPYCGKKIKVVE